MSTHAQFSECWPLLAANSAAHERNDLSPVERLVLAVAAASSSAERRHALVAMLREEGITLLDRLAELDRSALEALLEPVGDAVRGALKLSRVIGVLEQHAGGNLDEFEVRSPAKLREALAGERGIGLETADRALLALDVPTMPVSRAAVRILARHGWIDATSDYDELQLALRRGVPDPDSPELLRMLDEALSAIGNRYCRTVPRCTECPLQPLLPDGGPLPLEEFR